MKKNNVSVTDKNKMKLNRNIKESWTLYVAFAIFILIKVLSVIGIYQNDNLLGVAYLLMAVTFGYTCIKVGKRFQKEGRGYGHYAPIIFVGGIFTAVWIIEAIDLFFK